MVTRLLVVLLLVCWFAPKQTSAQSVPAVPARQLVPLPGEKPPVPDTVYVGVYFVWVYDLDMTDGSYSTKCWLWFRWSNPKLNPAASASIFNAKSFVYTDRVDRQIGNQYWSQLNCTAIIRQRYDLADFPFDKQTLRFRLALSGTDTSTIVLVAEPTSVYDPFNHPEGWKLKSFAVTAENRTYQTDFGDPANRDGHSTVSMFMATMRLQRIGESLFAKLLIGMYAAFMISWLSLFITPTYVDPRFGLSVGGLFACVGNKYIVDSILPDTVRDSLVDLLHGITFASVILTILLSVISLYYCQRENTRIYRRIDRYGALVIISLYTGVNLWLILSAMNS